MTTWTLSPRRPFSPCRDRARCRPCDFRNTSTDRGNEVVYDSRGSVSRRRTWRIERWSMTLMVSSWCDQSMIFRDTNIRHRDFYFYAELLRLVANNDTTDWVQTLQICFVKRKLLRLYKRMVSRKNKWLWKTVGKIILHKNGISEFALNSKINFKSGRIIYSKENWIF